jgi:hypothetical protein
MEIMVFSCRTAGAIEETPLQLNEGKIKDVPTRFENLSGS